jgi:hypothetical protein
MSLTKKINDYTTSARQDSNIGFQIATLNQFFSVASLSDIIRFKARYLELKDNEKVNFFGYPAIFQIDKVEGSDYVVLSSNITKTDHFEPIRIGIVKFPPALGINNGYEFTHMFTKQIIEHFIKCNFKHIVNNAVRGKLEKK